MVYIEVLILDIYYVRIQLKSRNIKQSRNIYIIFTELLSQYILEELMTNCQWLNAVLSNMSGGFLNVVFNLTNVFIFKMISAQYSSNNGKN